MGTCSGPPTYSFCWLANTSIRWLGNTSLFVIALQLQPSASWIEEFTCSQSKQFESLTLCRSWWKARRRWILHTGILLILGKPGLNASGVSRQNSLPRKCCSTRKATSRRLGRQVILPTACKFVSSSYAAQASNSQAILSVSNSRPKCQIRSFHIRAIWVTCLSIWDPLIEES